MEHRPFQCPNCRNWYISVIKENDPGCWVCQSGKHAVPKSGIVDCHHGQVSATWSEQQAGQLAAIMTGYATELRMAAEQIATARSIARVGELLGGAEMTFTKALNAYERLPVIMREAGLFELPGQQGEDPERAFKDIGALRALVNQHRRPATDLEQTERSLRVCTEMRGGIDEAMAGLRVAIARARQAVTSWTAPSEAEPEREMVGGRRKRRKKQEALTV